MSDYFDKNAVDKGERTDILKKRLDILISSLADLALFIDKNNIQAVKKMDEFIEKLKK